MVRKTRRINDLRVWAAGLAIFIVALLLGPWRWTEQPTSTPSPPGKIFQRPVPNDKHAQASSIKLSENGLKNIGFKSITVSLETFVKTISLPAMVIERPGRSQIDITAPLTGIITKIFPLHGTAVDPGGPLFTIRLTHEELVGSQQELIRTSENLSVVNREIARLKSLGKGIVAGERIVEKQYKKQQLEASLGALRQGLLLHGLTTEQVDDIINRQRLLQSITVLVPEYHDEGEEGNDFHRFHVQSLAVKRGQQVEAGQTLAVLADHCKLYVEGRAFEDDSLLLQRAARENWEISASLQTAPRKEKTVEGLKLLYLSDHVETTSRAFLFYLSLSNSVVLDRSSSGHRFIEWRFKPGQRMELYVPVDKWQERIVLPIDAVVDTGAEVYVYRQNGDHFDRVSVQVEYSDQNSVVVANNGSLWPGDIVATSGAYEMHLALKNQAGGDVDPHAGHSH